MNDPIATALEWWRDAQARDESIGAEGAQGGDLSSTMVLSTVSAAGRPSSRVVLLRALDARGFVFYTNLRSRKGRELDGQPWAALCMHWPRTIDGTLGRQLRVEGSVVRVDDAEADAYFAGRPRESQLGAWASDQSEPLVDRAHLFARLEEVRSRFEGQLVPRPPHWSGLRVVPDAIELWREGAARLHIRERYERPDPRGGWSLTLLNP